jgi:GNAT superfamily N-acetyltransferase
LGYYTLSAMSVDMSALSEEMRRRSGKYPVVPAVLLGRLATDQGLRGGGYGAALLADAMQRASHTGIGVKLVVVDALNDAAAHFYEHHGFHRFADAPMRLFLPVSTITDLLPETSAEGDTEDR